MSPTGSITSNPIHPAELGGTLFVPATHPSLMAVASGAKYPNLRSMVIDLEDGIDPDRRTEALEAVRTLLPALNSSGPLRFLRPASPPMLLSLLTVKGIKNINGFVLPKFGLENADAWLAPLRSNAFAFMPSVEGGELFLPPELRELADMLKPHRDRIPTVRFGLEDLLRQLGISRDCATPIYDLIAPEQVIGNMIATFKPRGFNVSGGVYKCFLNTEGFKAEVQEDLKQGLLGKTIIHPSQIDIIEEAYKVTLAEEEQADSIVGSTSNVTAVHGIMLEKTTQLPWAETILKRAALYGVRP